MEGNCCICGQFGKLSKEHIPPKSAFNKFPLVLDLIDMKATLEQGSPSWRSGRKFQNGHYSEVLCGKCNNDTGSWFGTSYAEFVKQLAPYAFIGNTGAVIAFTMKDLYPVRIAKQALAIMCGSCGPELANKYPSLRKLLLDRYSKESLLPWRLYCYLRNTQGMRATGVTSQLDHASGAIKVMAEFSWWPVGWILMQGSVDSRFPCYPVDHWILRYDYDDRTDLDVFLPCNWTETWYPADFRSPPEIERQTIVNKGLSLP